jgi:hypothetical protein
VCVVSDVTSLPIRTENFKGIIIKMWKLTWGSYLRQKTTQALRCS